MRILKNKTLKIIIILALLTGSLLSLKFLTLKKSFPQIVQTSPFNGQTQIPINTKIILDFDKNILVGIWQISPSPEFKFSLNIVENTLELVPSKPLEYETKYNLEIKNQKFKQFYYSFSFTTLQPPLPPIQKSGLGDPNFYEEIKKGVNDYYPLLQYVPYKTEFWSIDYLGPLKLEVILNKNTAEIRQEVLNWISSKGVDHQTHKIEWKM